LFRGLRRALAATFRPVQGPYGSIHMKR
jgi:hypothetical protein